MFLIIGGAAGLGAVGGLMLYQRSLLAKREDALASMEEDEEDEEGEEGEEGDEEGDEEKGEENAERES